MTICKVDQSKCEPFMSKSFTILFVLSVALQCDSSFLAPVPSSHHHRFSVNSFDAARYIHDKGTRDFGKSPTKHGNVSKRRNMWGSNRILSGPLFGISEWRDTMFNFPGTGDDRRLGNEEDGPPKEICILPFPYNQVLLQGETKQLRLYEKRFIELYEDCMTNHSGLVGMGLLADTGIIQTMPICEIEATTDKTLQEEFGIFLTIRAVGRARLVEVTQQTPYLKAVCVELADERPPPNLELPNLAASNIENFMLLLSTMEHRIAKAKEEKKKMNGDDDDNGDVTEQKKQDAGNDDGDDMQRRIDIANLEDTFYDTGTNEDKSNDDIDHDEDDDDDCEDSLEMDHRKRFQEAFEIAKATDTQGYCLPTVTNATTEESSHGYTVQELTAISWAAFNTELIPEADATYRIQALDCNKLFERLQLAAHMLREKRGKLKVQMDKMGVRFKNDQDDNKESGNFNS